MHYNTTQQNVFHLFAYFNYNPNEAYLIDQANGDIIYYEVRFFFILFYLFIFYLYI